MQVQNPEPRIQSFETVVAALVAILQACGRPAYMKSLFDLWAAMTNGLIIMDKLFFSELPPETSASLIPLSTTVGPWGGTTVGLLCTLGRSNTATQSGSHLVYFWIMALLLCQISP
jgi:hypothetical protein